MVCFSTGGILPPSLSEGLHTCRGGFCTQTATSQPSWPLRSVWREAHAPVQRKHRQTERINMQ